MEFKCPLYVSTGMAFLGLGKRRVEKRQKDDGPLRSNPISFFLSSTVPIVAWKEMF